MAKLIHYDASGNEILESGTINTGEMLPMGASDQSSVAGRIRALETVDYYQVPNAVADNATAQIPSTVWAHRYILINIRRYGYLGSMLIRKQNIVEGACGAGVCIYVSTSPKVFKISETGLLTALSNFGTDGQWVEFIGMF